MSFLSRHLRNSEYQYIVVFTFTPRENLLRNRYTLVVEKIFQYKYSLVGKYCECLFVANEKKGVENANTSFGSTFRQLHFFAL
jgi:hypothetical protein